MQMHIHACAHADTIQVQTHHSIQDYSYRHTPIYTPTQVQRNTYTHTNTETDTSVAVATWNKANVSASGHMACCQLSWIDKEHRMKVTQAVLISHCGCECFSAKKEVAQL